MKTTIPLLLLLFISACKKSGDDCSQYGETNITNVRYMGQTATGEKGKDAVFFDVSCSFVNGCYTISQFGAAVDEDTITIKAGYIYNPCAACTQAMVTQTKTFVFTPPDHGTYYIKWQGLPGRVDKVVIW